MAEDTRRWTLLGRHPLPDLTMCVGPPIEWGDRVEVVPAAELKRVEEERDRLKQTVADMRRLAG